MLEDAPESPFVLELGRLDPVSTTRGVKARLRSLGLYLGELDAPGMDAELRAAVEQFQRAYGVPVSGVADVPTREKLRAVCGG